MKHIRTKLIVSIALIVIVTFTSLTIGIIYYAKNQVAKTNILELSAESNTYSNDISNWMKKKINLIESCASTMSFQSDLSREDIEEIVDDHFKRDKELLNFYFGQPNSDFYQSLKDAELPKGYDPCKRDWYIKAKETKKTYVTDPYWDVLTNQMCDTVAVPVYHNKKLVGVLGIDMTLKTVTEKTKNINFDDDVYAFLLDGSKNIVYHPDKSLLPTKDKTHNALEALPQFKSNIENIKDEAILSEDSDGTNVYNVIKKIDSCPWTLGIVQPEKNINREITELSKISTTMGLSILVIVIVISIFVISKLVGPLKKMTEDIARVSKGDLNVDISSTNRKDEIGSLQNSVVSLKENITDIIGNSNRILKEITSGNLKVADMQSFPGSFNELADLINSIKALLCNLIGQINSASSEITTGSKQLAIAADSLASHSSEQALSIQTLQNHVTDISSGIHRNSENCNLVNNNLNHLFNKIKEGNTEMETLHSLVDDIEKMSTGIQDVVETINEISFQTNILALNASVEAAHAGDLGSGFAIVADEVRNLAYKSAEEANKTQELVDKCIVMIKDAKSRADVTSECLTEIVTNSSQIETAFKQISEDTNKQDEHQTRISQELDKISVGVESNTATAQETAASTSELSKEATVLSDLIQKFIV